MDLFLILYIACSMVLVTGSGLWINALHEKEVTKWKMLYSKEALLRQGELTEWEQRADEEAAMARLDGED